MNLKYLNVSLLPALATILLCGFTNGDDLQGKKQISFVIESNKQISDRPISHLIYGSFIELGLGRAADGLWGQMLYNRSFENIPPLVNALNEQGRDFNKTSPWWTSWYEEQPWYTYNQDGKTEIPAERKNNFWAFYHGKLGASASDKRDGAWGIGQDGIWLRAGTDYLFRGFLAHEIGGDNNEYRKVTVRLVAEDDPSHVVANAECQFGAWFTECKATLRNPGYTGRASLLVEATWPGKFYADGFELFPSDAVKGWRRDIIDAIKHIGPPILRFPGGCFASFYNWMNGIGPKDDRMPARVEFWGGLEYNDIGTDEFLDLCKEVGSEPFLVVNIISGTPGLAAEWVEYCNGSPDTEMGKLRVANGHLIPRKVTYWELDNEVSRKYSPEQYAGKVIGFAKAMKAVDPSIKIAIVGYDQTNWKLDTVLDICGQYIDFVSDRAFEDENFSRDRSILETYQKKTGRRIGLCNTEWVAPLDPPSGILLESTDRSRYQQWYYAMNAAKVIQRYWRNAEWMDFANFNHLINTWGLNAIESSKSATWLSCAGKVLEFYSNSRSVWPVEVSPVNYKETVHVAAALSESKDEMVVNIINMGEGTSLNITLAGGWKIKSTRGIFAPSLNSRNTEAEENTVSEIKPDTKMQEDHLTVNMPKYAIAEVMLGRK